MSPLAQRLAAAVQHHEAGRFGEAEVLYRAILLEFPQHPHALHLLGVLAHQTRRHQEAIDLIGRALTVHGPHPVFHSNLAAAYLDKGRLIEAAAHCREAIRLQPALADAHNNLGVALRGLGQLDEAESAFREAVRQDPRHIDARANLGAVLHRQGKLPEAVECLREALRLAPRNAEVQNNLGGALAALGHFDEAVRHLEEAIRLRPQFAGAYSNLGVALDNLNQIDRAIQCQREALRLDPANAGAHNNLGSTLKNQGRMDEALAEFQAALRLDPNNAVAIFNLSKLAAVGYYHFSEEEIEAIQDLLERKHLPLDSRCRLNFTLAQVFDKAGQYDAAFGHLRQANEQRQELYRRRGAVFNLPAQRQLVDRLIAICTPAYFERVQGFGVNSELPIFIVGMPRSGTTLTEQILASHPRVHGAGELPEIELLAAVLHERLRTTERYPECLEKLDAAHAQALAEKHLERLRQLGGAAARVVDKMPFNFLHLGLIATLFPGARIIHCRRDPVDVCLSCFFQNFAEHSPFTLDLQHLGLYYREYQRLMAHWKQVLPMPMFELNYEDLTADQERVSRELVAFCGLEWDERCLRFYDSQRTVRTFSTLEVRRPMYRSSVGRWKRYENHLQPLLEALKGEENFAADLRR